MSRNRMIAAGLVLLLLGAGATWAHAQDSGVTLDTLLTPDQQRAMGLQKLTPGEKEVLLRYLVLVYQLGMRSCTGGAAPVQPPSPGLSPGQPPPIPRQYVAGEHHWVQENVNAGDLMILEDGSVWKVNPYDKINALLWLPASEIVILDGGSRCLAGEYLLVNTDDGEGACARPAGSQ